MSVTAQNTRIRKTEVQRVCQNYLLVQCDGGNKRTTGVRSVKFCTEVYRTRTVPTQHQWSCVWMLTAGNMATLRTSDTMSDKFNISEYVTFFTKLKRTIKYDKCSRAIRLQSCELVSRRLFLLGTPCINMSKCSYCWCFLCILRKIGFNPRSVYVGLWWTKWQWDRTFPRVFRFFPPLSASFHIIHSSVTGTA